MGSSRATIQNFYGNVLESSSDEESDGEIDLLIAIATMVNDHYLMPSRRGGHRRSACPTLIAIEKCNDPKVATFKD
jgi:hypothetical protein